MSGMGIDALALIAAFAAAWAGTLGLRRYSLSRQILDVPNARSSHTRPTPRGGGVAIVVSFLAGLALLHLLGRVDASLFAALIVGGSLIALVGFWDDHASLPARVRIVFHFAAAAWALYCLGGWPRLDLGFAVIEWDAWGYLVGTIALVWLLNLYNFMDGIDGIAASEAVSVACGGALLLWIAGASPLAPLMLAASSLGFAVLNWPPAKIFMGDAGSGFLGYVLGVLALHASATGSTALWPWLILLGVFVVDATVTMVRRMLRGQRWYEAHRSHAYQWAARRYGAHLPVTLAVVLIDLIWLLPCALAAASWPSWSVPVALLALLPLVAVALRYRSGEPER
ncbi:MAG: MraY family glycosyltransferase [Gammaproteobacteria bacterium]